MPTAGAANYSAGRSRDRKTARQPAKVYKIVRRPQIRTNLRRWAAVFFIVAAITSGITVARSEISAMRGYELVQARQKAAQLENENRQLEVQIAELKSPQRIKNIATQKLGMIVPDEVYFSSDKEGDSQ